MKVAIFSGRFDPLHTGHIITIVKLMKRFSRVILVVLDYPERETFTAVETKEMLDTIFGTLAPDRVETIVDTKHFGQMTIAYYCELLNDLDLDLSETVYCSGNMQVIDHIKQLGIPWEFVSRTEGFSGGDERNWDVREKYGSSK